jgi:hypothetical protein
MGYCAGMRLAGLCLVVGCGFTPGQSAVRHDDAAADAPDATPDAVPDALPSDLIAYYPMESTPMTDVTGHGHDGTCTACPTVGAGVVGNALVFDTARVDIPSAADLRTMTGTTAAWIVFDTLPAAYACPFGAIYNQPANGDTWQLCIHDSTMWGVFLQTTAGSREFDAPATLVAGVWHHVALTWTTTTEQFFVDGVMIENNPITPLVFDQSLLTVGADRLTAGTIDVPMRGRLDELKLFDRALSQEEIAALMVH